MDQRNSSKKVNPSSITVSEENPIPEPTAGVPPPLPDGDASVIPMWPRDKPNKISTQPISLDPSVTVMPGNNQYGTENVGRATK